MIKLALIILIAAIGVLFSKEIGKLFRTIAKKKSANLLLSLLITSALIIYYEPFVLAFLWKIKINFHQFGVFITQLLPGNPQFNLFVINSLFLTLCAILPAIIIKLWAIKSTQEFNFAYIISIFFWVFFAILVTAGYSY